MARNRKFYTQEELDYLKFIGKKIKRRRLQIQVRNRKNKMQTLTQMLVAEIMEVTFQQVQKYEKGINTLSLLRIKSMAKALKIPGHRVGFLINKYNKKGERAWMLA